MPAVRLQAYAFYLLIITLQAPIVRLLVSKTMEYTKGLL